MGLYVTTEYSKLYLAYPPTDIQLQLIRNIASVDAICAEEWKDDN